MSLKPRPILEVPEETARIAHAAFPKGNIYLRIRDQLGVFFEDEQFTSLFPKCGQPAFSPWRLALVSIMQFAEDLSDREAADAVRSRIDWKYLLGLEMEDAGFDYSILSEFRQRIIDGGLEQKLLDRILTVLREQSLLKKRGKQRTDSTHVIAAARHMNRVENIGETMRATLNVLATVAPDWLQQIAPPEWYDRYEVRIDESVLPRDKKERETWITTVAADGIYLLTSIYESETQQWLCQVPAVQTLRMAWIYQFYYIDSQLQLRKAKDMPPSSIRFESPYDTEAHYSTKRGMEWRGYKVHFTESCDDNHPHLITHVETTIAPKQDADMVPLIHEALAEKNCLPKTHFADAAYVNAEQIVVSGEEYHTELVGPVRANSSWQTRARQGFGLQDFHLDWDTETATCPMGIVTKHWWSRIDARGDERIHIRFPRLTCRQCQSRTQCTRSSTEPRTLSLLPRAQYEALLSVRQQQKTIDWQERYAKRAGVEGTISQAVRGFGLRHCRYIGLAKTRLQHILTAAAINLSRLNAWFMGKKRTQTRVSRFALLQPVPG